MASEKIFISLAGNIGSGKTTLTRLLSEKFRWSPHYESVTDNPYLKDFYCDMKRWSFPLQIYFLKHRFQAHQTITDGYSSAVQDRSVYEDANIFARNLLDHGYMDQRDYSNYFDLYQTMLSFLQPPHLVVYLKKSLPQLKERIAMRGREYEKAIPDDYLENLNDYYNEWISSYRLGKKLTIDTDNLDFIRNRGHFLQLADLILNSLDQPDLFLGSQIQSFS